MYRVNHSWLYGSVKPHFEKSGIKLLKDDMQFIEKCLGNVPPEAHRKLMVDYFTIWNTSIADNAKGDSVAVNPRYEANVYLRESSNTKGKLKDA